MAARLTQALVVAILAAVLATPVARAGDAPAPAAAHPTLAERAAAIERVAEGPDGLRVVLGHISRELDIPVETLRTRHATTGLSWGELLLAERLAGEAGIEFDAVVAEHAAGRSWEAIARAHRVDLAALDAQVARAQEIVAEHIEDPTLPMVKTGAPRPAAPGRRGAAPAGGRGRRD